MWQIALRPAMTREVVLRRLFRSVAKIVKWLIVAALCLEILSFLAITTSNYILYARLREGGPSGLRRVHALFTAGGSSTDREQFSLAR